MRSAGDDPTPWNLLHDGKLVAIRRAGATVRLTIELPHLRVRFEPRGEAFLVQLHEVESFGYLPYTDRWDEPVIEELAAIVAEQPNLVEAEARTPTRDDPATMIVWGSLGSLRLAYASLELALDGGRPLTLAELNEAHARYWQDWRARWSGESVHPLVHAATRDEWTVELLAALLDAWRSERTSDLASTIEIVEEISALTELVVDARSTWDLLLGDGPEMTYDQRAATNAERWAALTGSVATLRAALPDPRIGRAIEGMLRGPSDCWFRIDQVAHIAGPFEAPNDEPSFADHALALLAEHGDAGSVERLRDKARRLRIEADCNTAEMAERLDALAEKLEQRWPSDRTLPDAAEQALRARSRAG
jgi:hypothetical protein